MQHIISLVGENVSQFFQSANPLFKAIYRHFNYKRVIYNLHYIRLPCSQILSLQNTPKILSFNAQPTTQIACTSEEKQNNLKQFCRVASEVPLFSLPLNCSKQMQDHRSTDLSPWVSALVGCIILEQEKVVSLLYPGLQHGGIKGMETPHADHPSELHRAQSHEGKSLPKHVKMKNGTWNISFECDMGATILFKRNREYKSPSELKLKWSPKAMPSKTEDSKVSKSVKELFTQSTRLTEMHNHCTSQVALISLTCMITVSSSLTQDRW